HSPNPCGPESSAAVHPGALVTAFARIEERSKGAGRPGSCEEVSRGGRATGMCKDVAIGGVTMFGTLVPWRTRFPATLRRMEREMEELMGRAFPEEEFWALPEKGFIPPANVAETEKGYEVTMDLPGIEAKEVNVEIREGSLW